MSHHAWIGAKKELSQGEILLTILRNKDDWTPDIGFESWDEDEIDQVCYWEGINCDPLTESIVEGIFIPTKNMTGTLPSELGLLKSLRELSMPGNLLTGTIPSEVAALPNLEIVNLSMNKFSGNLPCFKSTNLQSLELKENRLTGSVDPEFGNRHVLMKELDLSKNSLTGSIPVFFEKMDKLDSLALGENHLTGTIPGAIGTMEKLRFVYLNKNHFVGTIPPSLSDLPQLEYLWIQDNMLSGTVPTALADVVKLTDFYIDGNKLTGDIPPDLCRKGLNKDFFDNDKNDYEENCEDIACQPGTSSKDGIGPCASCSGDLFNPFIGRSGECINVTDVSILEVIYDKTSAAGWKTPWDRNDIWCVQPGVECDNFGHVVGLNLKGMGLSGTIPEEIGYLKYLKSLDLSDNNLTGYVPSELRFAPLEKLNISGNKLKGEVPLMLCMKPGINGIGFGCEHIACPVGSYSNTGTSGGENDGDHVCAPCKDGLGYLARKSCSDRSGSASNLAIALGVTLFLIHSFALLGGCMFLELRRRRKKNEKIEFAALEEDII